MSLEQFTKDMKEEFGAKWNDDEIREMYDAIELPTRATVDSAGYDFHAPFTFTLAPNEVIKIPTGIRVKIEQGWFLGCFPRSGLGFKYAASLSNTVGIIDALYYQSDNLGHIFCKMINRSTEDKVMTVNMGQGFMQGIFLPFGVTYDDNSTGIRNGGFGSTDIQNG